MARRGVDKEQGTLVDRTSCIFDDCISSDAGSVYEHEDGSFSFYCFSCNKGVKEFDRSTLKSTVQTIEEINWEVELEKLEEVRDGLIAVSNRERKIKQGTYEKYGCRMELQDDGESIDAIYYPTYRTEDEQNYTHVGYRNRKRFKAGSKAVEKKPALLNVMKDFSGGIGDTKKGICMFGQWLFDPSKEKRVIITCGEEDALAVYEMTSLRTKFDGGYPTVSVPSGENVNLVKPHLKWLSRFEEIYIVPDQDKVGQEFGKALAKLLPAGKVRIVKLPQGKKDPCDMWKVAKAKDMRERISTEFWRCLWNSEKYSPAGILSLSEGWSSFMERGTKPLIPFPDSFGDLNALTYGGAALGEIVNFIAPSSVGKSSFVKEWIYKMIHSTSYKIGILSFEEDIGEFIEGMLSVAMSVQLNEIPVEERNNAAMQEAFEELIHHYPEGAELDTTEVSDERIHYVDHQGACSGKELLEKIDFLTKGLDCEIIIVDPATLACSGLDTNEDEMASEFVKRTKHQNLLWCNVHHVRKNDQSKQANSEGGDLSEESIKGSGVWFQTAMINLIFTRNKVHENPIVKNTTRIKMSKCRRHGKSTGIAGYIYYNGETGRLEKGMSPEEILGEDNHEAYDDYEDNYDALNSFTDS